MAVAAVRQLSPDEQDEIARAILGIVGGTDDEPYLLSDDEKAAIARSRAAADRGEFATEEQVEAVFSKYSR